MLAGEQIGLAAARHEESRECEAPAPDNAWGSVDRPGGLGSDNTLVRRSPPACSSTW